MFSLAKFFVPLGSWYWIPLGWAFWSALAVLLLALVLVLRNLTQNPASRSLIWTVAFVLLGLGPWLDLLGPKLLHFSLAERAILPNSGLGRAESVIPKLQKISQVDNTVSPIQTATHEMLDKGISLGWNELILSVTLLLLLGSLVMLSLVLHSWFSLRGLKTRSTLLKPGAELRRLEKLFSRQGLNRKVEVRISPEMQTPATMGFLRPVLFLPQDDWRSYLNKSRVPLLLHELGHMVRLDYLRAWLSHITTATFWFLPLSWLGRKLFRSDMEMACDDYALRRAGTPLAFAGVLGHLALGAKNACPACSLCLVETKALVLQRMRRAIDGQAGQPDSPKSLRLLGMCASLGLLSLFAISTLSQGKNGLSLQARTSQSLQIPGNEVWGQVYQHYQNKSGSLWKPLHPLSGKLVLSPDLRYRIQLNNLGLAHLNDFVERVPLFHNLSLESLKPSVAQIQILTQLPELKVLDLSRTNVNDEFLEVLTQFTFLRELYLHKSQFSIKGIASLKRMLPNTEIALDAYSIRSLQEQSERQLIAWPKVWTLLGPLAPENISSDTLAMNHIPQKINIGGKEVIARRMETESNQWLNIEKTLGFHDEHQVAWLYSEYVALTEQTVEVWAAADWWMSWYIDGKAVYNTDGRGNRSTEYDYPNHSFKITFSPGKHVIAVRVSSGSQGWGMASTAVL